MVPDGTDQVLCGFVLGAAVGRHLHDGRRALLVGQRRRRLTDTWELRERSRDRGGRIRLCVVEVDDGQQRGVGSDPEPSGEQVERDARWGVLWAVACVGPPGTQAGRGNGEHEE